MRNNCNMDCFNCPYADCIIDEDTAESTEIDKALSDEFSEIKTNATYKYNHSKKGKECRKRYLQSDKGKEAQRRYNQSEKGKASRRKAQNTDATRKAKREYYYRKKVEQIESQRNLLLARG